MFQYLNLLRQCRKEGVVQKNRTGVDTLMIPGGMMQFNLGAGFPIVTTKEVNFKAVVAELLGFLRGVDSAAEFRKLGTKIWDANANQNQQWLGNIYRKGPDDLGRVYGQQWRRWRCVGSEGDTIARAGMYYCEELDQISRLLDMIHKDPTSRRMIVTAWQPGELNRMALPPCHLMWQVLIEQSTRKMHMTMYMRSCDMFLGVPFNISSYALLLSLLARATSHDVGILTMFLADVHIYENHIKQVDEQLTRWPRHKPKLVVESDCTPYTPIAQLEWLEKLEPHQIWLEEYDHHPALKAPMAV